MPRRIPDAPALVRRAVGELGAAEPLTLERVAGHIASSLPADAPLPPDEQFRALVQACLDQQVSKGQMSKVGSCYRIRTATRRKGKGQRKKGVEITGEEDEDESFTDRDHAPFSGSFLACPLRVPQDLHVGDQIAVFCSSPHSAWYEGTVSSLKKQSNEKEHVCVRFSDGDASLLLKSENYGPENTWVLLQRDAGLQQPNGATLSGSSTPKVRSGASKSGAHEEVVRPSPTRSKCNFSASPSLPLDSQIFDGLSKATHPLQAARTPTATQAAKRVSASIKKLHITPSSAHPSKQGKPKWGNSRERVASTRFPQRNRRPASDAWLDPWKDLKRRDNAS